MFLFLEMDCNHRRLNSKRDKTRKGEAQKFQQTPGTYPRYQESKYEKKSLHKQVVKCPGYVPGVCWNFLRETKITHKKTVAKKPPAGKF